MGENKIRIIMASILLIITIFIGGFVILYFAMGLETIPPADFAAYTALVALLEQYEYFLCHAIASIFIPRFLKYNASNQKSMGKSRIKFLHLIWESAGDPAAIDRFSPAGSYGNG